MGKASIEAIHVNSRSPLMKLSIIMPVYNEANYIDEIISKVSSVDIGNLKKEIIIIESNSTDGTRDLIKKYENKIGFKIIYEEKPRGKGHAVRKGFKAATGDIILIQDADLEYNPDEYPKLLKPILEGNIKFVLGSRHLGNNGWVVRKFTNDPVRALVLNVGSLGFNFLFNILYGTWITDPTTMYKVFRSECLADIEFKSDYFDLDWEIVGKFIRKGYIPIEVPISYYSRSNSEGKKFKLRRDVYKNLRSVIKYRFVN